VTHQLSVAE